MNNKKKLLAVGLVVGAVALAVSKGPAYIFNTLAQNNLDAAEGTLALSGIDSPISIRRDDYGVPFIEAASLTDLTFGVGYATAEDRLAQMVSMNLLARGRLAEMAGEVAVGMDIYIRTLGVRNIIEGRYQTFTLALTGYMNIHAGGLDSYFT